MRATMVLRVRRWRRGWDSNPRTPVKMLLEFQSSAFDRSATSPIRYLRDSLVAAPQCAPEARPKGARIIKHGAPSRTRRVGGGLQACGAAAGLVTLKEGGWSRQGSLGPRGGGGGSLSTGSFRRPAVSGASTPSGIFSVAPVRALW